MTAVLRRLAQGLWMMFEFDPLFGRGNGEALHYEALMELCKVGGPFELKVKGLSHQQASQRSCFAGINQPHFRRAKILSIPELFIFLLVPELHLALEQRHEIPVMPCLPFPSLCIPTPQLSPFDTRRPNYTPATCCCIIQPSISR